MRLFFIKIEYLCHSQTKWNISNPNRIMKTIIYTISILFTLCSFSGKENDSRDKYEIIPVDLSRSKALDIRDCARYNIRKIPLELSDQSLLTYIDQIEIRDNKIYVYDKHRLIVFDINGNYLDTIGGVGPGPGEYTNINSFFFEGNNVCVYDDNLQKLFIYDKDGTFITSKQTKEPIYSIYAINNKKFIGRKKYQGSTMKVPVLAILNENLNLISDIKNRYLTSGISVFDYCYSFDTDILYWEFLNDTIYSVKAMEVVPAYYVDFQKYKVSAIKKKNKDITEIIEHLNSTDAKYATGLRYIQEDASGIRFIFSFDEKVNYVRYDKQKKKVLSCYFYDSKGILDVQYFMKYQDGKIILSVNDSEDEDANPILLFIDDLRF